MQRYVITLESDGRTCGPAAHWRGVALRSWRCSRSGGETPSRRPSRQPEQQQPVKEVHHAERQSVILMGNLTRDPQPEVPAESDRRRGVLACNRRFKTWCGEDKEEVTFVDCTAFGRTGEVINQYFTKGKPIFIEGRLKYDQWEDKQGGGKRSKITVVAMIPRGVRAQRRPQPWRTRKSSRRSSWRVRCRGGGHGKRKTAAAERVADRQCRRVVAQISRLEAPRGL